MPGGGSSGGGMSGGGSSGSGAGGTRSGGGSGGAGSVGGVPQIEIPGGFPGTGGGDGQQGDGGEGDDPYADAESTGQGDCGDTGVLPGGIGGMGQAGDCTGAEAGMDGADGGGSGTAGGDAQGGEGTVAGTGGVGSVGQFPGESDAERAERLGKELEESIGGFDEVLNEEQREVASAGRNLEGFGGGAGGRSGGSVSLGEQGGGSVAVVNTGKEPRVSPTAGMTEEEIRERTPDDIPVTVDDDIIARQLREAALAEEDPELRERLWEEYRKYKGS